MDFYNERRVKRTRKEHKCFGCLKKLLTGSTAFYVSGVYEGDFGAYYLCIPCRDYLDCNLCEDGDFWSEGDLGDARRQECVERGEIV